eukprot:Skav224062  [mRNA]  locus=scaffold534:584314:590480:- [translate_table: standard]
MKALKSALELFGTEAEAEADSGLARSGEARALHGLASASGRLEDLGEAVGVGEAVVVSQQDFRSSVSRAREAAAIWQELGYRLEEHRRRSRAGRLELEFLARLQLQLGQYKEGRKSGEEALKIFIGEVSMGRPEALHLAGCGAANFSQGRPGEARAGAPSLALLRGKKVKEARKLVNRRMALFEEAKDLVGICGALDATAEVLMAEGEATKAAELLKEAARKAKQTQMKEKQLRKYEATMAAEQANFYLQGQKYDDALQHAKNAFHLFEKINCQVEMATTLSTMVMAHLCLEHPQQALEERPMNL